MLLFRFEYKTSVIGHNVNTQNVKIATWDRPHIRLNFTPVWNLWKPFSYWYCFSEENSFREFTLKTLSDDLNQCKHIYSFYVADQDTARYSFFFNTGKVCKFSRTLYNRQLIQFARIPVEFVVRFIRYQNRVKVITFSIDAWHLLLISPYCWCLRDLRVQFLELYTACILSQ